MHFDCEAATDLWQLYMDVRVTPIDRLLTIHKSAVISIFLHFVYGRYRTARSWDWEWVGMVKWNGPFRSDWSNREKWSTSKGGPLFSKLFRLDRTDPLSFRLKFPEILVEWIAPTVSLWIFVLEYPRRLQTISSFFLDLRVSHLGVTIKLTLR